MVLDWYLPLDSSFHPVYDNIHLQFKLLLLLCTLLLERDCMDETFSSLFFLLLPAMNICGLWSTINSRAVFLGLIMERSRGGSQWPPMPVGNLDGMSIVI